MATRLTSDAAASSRESSRLDNRLTESVRSQATSLISTMTPATMIEA